MSCQLILTAAFVFLTWLVPTAAVAGEKEIALKPTTPWLSEWTKHSCVLRRGFGSKDDLNVLKFEGFAPTPLFQLVIMSDSLKFMERGRYLAITFGQNASQDYTNKFEVGSTDSGLPAVFITNIGIVGAEELARIHPNALPLLETAANTVSVETRGRKIVFETGELGKPFDALRTCLDDLVKSWKLDPDVQRSLLRGPEPKTTPDKWLRPGDYPASALQSGKQAIVNFRLIIDAQGVPTECAIQSSYSGEKFDDITCRKIMERARFEPALDKDGKPVTSYHINSVRWIMR